MYRIISVDGQEEAEKLLNETIDSHAELVQAHIHTVRDQRRGLEQSNLLMDEPVTRFTFIFRM